MKINHHHWYLLYSVQDIDISVAQNHQDFQHECSSTIKTISDKSTNLY